MNFFWITMAMGAGVASALSICLGILAWDALAAWRRRRRGDFRPALPIERR